MSTTIGLHLQGVYTCSTHSCTVL